MKTVTHEYDFVVVGGGLSGLCAALTAAREGLKTALVQDRPVLGGNSSKEIRVPPVGATGCNYMYCRETGIIEEIQLTNLYLNPSGNHERWDLLLQSFAYDQENLSLFLDTVVQTVQTDDDGSRLVSVTGYTLGTELYQVFAAPLFSDCTGDGTVAALAGAEFMIGKEAESEFNESMAPKNAETGGMGMSLQFRARDIGRNVDFKPPAWVDLQLDEDSFGPFRDVCGGFLNDHGGFWWLEWGGNLDTIHQTPTAKKQVLKIVYAVWGYLKNQSEIRDRIRSFELDWVGSIVGKRESRRIIGDHILTQGNIERADPFNDAIAFGGWGFDDHPGDGFLATEEASYHIKHASPYNIPLRSLYSKDIDNLFLAGRDISVTHIGLSSTRVMLTCAQIGEAVGMAAAACNTKKLSPRELAMGPEIKDVQRALMWSDHYIHKLASDDHTDIARKASVTASSTLSAPILEKSHGVIKLATDLLWQFPLKSERLNEAQVLVDVSSATDIEYVVYSGAINGNTYPERQVFSGVVSVSSGEAQWVILPCAIAVDQPGWHYLELKANSAVSVHTGQAPPVGIAGFMIRPEDPIRPNPFSRWSQFNRNGFTREAFCLRISPEQPIYQASSVIDPYTRPWQFPHLWISQRTDFSQPEWIQLAWDTPQTFFQINIMFDSSLDFTFYQSWQGYPDNVIPSLVSDYALSSSNDRKEWSTIVEISDNYLRRRLHTFAPVKASYLRLSIGATRAWPRAQVYSIGVS